MTREERKKAIEVLDDMKVKIDIPKAAKTQNDRNWALDMAISAFEQEPCEDAISREAAISAVVNADNAQDEIDSIRALPPVTPSRHKGHWIKTNSGYECSECAIESRSKSDFCQYCGTEMESEK